MNTVPPLLSLVLTLRPLESNQASGKLPRWWGYAAYALLLDQVRRFDAALAKSLHDENALKPFTVSTLVGQFSEGQLDLRQPCTLRFTALIPELAHILLESFQLHGEIQLNEQTFLIEQIAKTPEEHPWAGSATWEELAGKSLMMGSTPPKRITFLFASPTTFRSNGRFLPMPLPKLVFDNLTQRWNSYAPLAFPEEVNRYAAECLQISSYRLNSSSVSLQENAVRIGGMGKVTYTAAPYDRYWMSIIHTLGRFALYAGVGAATTMGLGQVRILTPEAQPKETSER